MQVSRPEDKFKNFQTVIFESFYYKKKFRELVNCINICHVLTFEISLFIIIQQKCFKMAGKKWDVTIFLTSRPPRVITLSHNKTPTIRVYGKFKRRMHGDTMSGQVDRFTRDL